MSNIVPTISQGQTPPGGITQPGTTAPTFPTAPAFGTQKRTTNEILVGRPQYDCTLRASSTLQEKLKIMEKATVGAITKLQSVFSIKQPYQVPTQGVHIYLPQKVQHVYEPMVLLNQKWYCSYTFISRYLIKGQVPLQ